MQLNLTIAIWNANGISNHKNEVEIFLKNNFIDIFLISDLILQANLTLK